MKDGDAVVEGLAIINIAGEPIKAIINDEAMPGLVQTVAVPDAFVLGGAGPEIPPTI
jgi:hypothetical protein